MMNMLDTQDKLKNFSEQQLIGQMQSPTGDVPQFLVLGEIERRKRMRNDAQRQQGTNQTTVAQDAIVAAGVPQTGIADMAQALAPKTDMTQNTGIMSVAPQAEPQKMASGGVVKMAEGREVTGGPAFTDFLTINQANRAGKSVAQYLNDLPPDELARVQSNAARRAALRAGNQTPSLDNVFDPSLSAFEQTGSGELRPTSETMNLDALAAMGASPTSELGGPSVYNAPLPTLPTAAEIRAQDNPAPAFVPLPKNSDRTLSDFLDPKGVRMSDMLRRTDRDRQDTDPGPTAAEQGIIDKRNKFYRDLYGGISDRVLSTTSGLAANYNDLESYASNTVAGLTGLVPGLEGYTLEELKAAEDKAALAKRQREYSNRRAEEVVERTNAGATELQNPMVREALRKANALPVAPVAPIPAVPAIPVDQGLPALAAETVTGETGGGAGGAGGGTSAASSYEQALLDTLANREKAQKQDKWLALAQVGLGMMNSQSPTLAGAIGEAGLKGVESFRQSRDQYDNDRLKILGDIEQYKMARAAAQAKAAGGGGGGFRQELKDQASVMGLIEDLQGQADAIRENAALSGGKDLEAEKRARAFEARANTLASMIGIDAGNAGGPATLALPSAAQP
jgi:hypothetical protein